MRSSLAKFCALVGLASTLSACVSGGAYPPQAGYRWVMRHEPWDPYEPSGQSMIDQIPNNQRAADVCGVTTHRC